MKRFVDRVFTCYKPIFANYARLQMTPVRVKWWWLQGCIKTYLSGLRQAGGMNKLHVGCFGEVRVIRAGWGFETAWNPSMELNSSNRLSGNEWAKAIILHDAHGFCLNLKTQMGCLSSLQTKIALSGTSSWLVRAGIGQIPFTNKVSSQVNVVSWQSLQLKQAAPCSKWQFKLMISGIISLCHTLL